MGFRSGGGLKKKVSHPANLQWIKNGLQSLHAITDSHVFDAALMAFYWCLMDMGETPFMHHFDDEYGTGDKRNWTYARLGVGIPTTNNGLEAVNRVFKQSGTHRDRWSVTRFISIKAANWLHHTSQEDTFFATFPTPTSDLWEKAQWWAKSWAPQLAQRTCGDGFYSMVIPSEDTLKELKGNKDN